MGYVAPTVIDGNPVPAQTLNDAFDALEALDASTPTAWTALTLSSGWAAGSTPPSVRKLNPTTVHIAGNFTPGATKANGTNIGTIPVGYRPAHDLDLVVSCDVTVAGGQMPHLNISAANGNIACWGVSAAGSVGVTATYPTNL